MDESELRIAALETLLIDLLALAEPKVIVKLEANLGEGLVGKGEPGHDGDEQAIRLQALQIVRDAKLRHELFTPSRIIRQTDA